MKLVKQDRLEYREGASDKVYEVDLCEVSTGRYVVNFRYGRRGAALKEGTKTPQPVDLAKAEAIRADLTGSKLKKGYVVAGSPAQDDAKAKAAAGLTADASDRARAVLDRLSRGPDASRWPIERAAWRAGELGLREAVPDLVRLIGTGTPMRDYVVAWALGRCGDQAAVEPLSKLFANASTPGHVSRIAREALLRLSSVALQEQFRVDTRRSLPESLRAASETGDATIFSVVLDEYLSTPDRERVAVLEVLYLVDDPVVRPGLLATLRRVPLEPPWVRPVRRIFKAAEYRRDAEVFGVIAYRFEKSKARFRNTRGYGWVYGRRPDGSFFSLRVKEALVKEDPEVAFGHETRTYFRRRVWRTLRRLGELGDPDFVRMAVGTLLPFTDADRDEPKKCSYRYWSNGRFNTHTHEYGPFAAYLAFNSLLYTNSPRFALARTGVVWEYRGGASKTEPQGREEAFPELWDATPAGLLHLLAESACEEVHRFAVKAIRSSPELLDRLDDSAVEMLLGARYALTVRLGWEIAARRYKSSSPSLRLLVALASCRIDEARAKAREWIDAAAGQILADENALASLALSPYSDTRRFAIALLGRRRLDDAPGLRLARRAVEALAACGAEDGDRARDLGDLLVGPLAPFLPRLGVDAVALLVTHPVEEVRLAAVRVFSLVDAPSGDVLSRFVPALLESEDEAIRASAIGIVLGMSDADLLASPESVLALVFHPRDDVRDGVRPLVARLSTPFTGEDAALAREGLPPTTPPEIRAAKTAFAALVAERALAALVAPEPFEGLHDSLAHTLREDVPGGLMFVTEEQTWRLIKDGTSAAQSVGGAVLEANHAWGAALTTDEIVDLAIHEIQSIRSAARAIYPEVLNRFMPVFNRDSVQELARLVRVLDCPWERDRRSWFEMFRMMQPDQFTPAILIAICDSPLEETRGLGRELVVRNARPEDGLTYLTQLAEHPSGDVQLFVTNYLDAYARDDAARLAELAPYFVSVLSRVNSGRVAKDRVLGLLADEAAKSEASARVAATVLSRLAATVAVGDRARAIESLAAIHRRYPDVDVPLAVTPVEVRHAV